jgi:hypothetical protein
MNICILSYSRCGGTTFANWLSKEFNVKYIHEPFNKNHNWIYKNINFLKDEYVVKLEPEDLDKIPGDKITIGLIRENTYDCAISNLKASQMNRWHSPYKVGDSWLKENEIELEKLSKKIAIQNFKIKQLKLNIIISYEGLYETGEDIKKIQNLLNIKVPKYLELMDKSLKYRNGKERII